METQTQIVIGIPGKWPTRSDIVTAIATKSNGLIFAGLVLVGTTAQEGYGLEVYDYPACGWLATGGWRLIRRVVRPAALSRKSQASRNSPAAV